MEKRKLTPYELEKMTTDCLAAVPKLNDYNLSTFEIRYLQTFYLAYKDKDEDSMSVCQKILDAIDAEIKRRLVIHKELEKKRIEMYNQQPKVEPKVEITDAALQELLNKSIEENKNKEN